MKWQQDHHLSQPSKQSISPSAPNAAFIIEYTYMCVYLENNCKRAAATNAPSKNFQLHCLQLAMLHALFPIHGFCSHHFFSLLIFCIYIHIYICIYCICSYMQLHCLSIASYLVDESVVGETHRTMFQNTHSCHFRFTIT